MTDIPFEKAAKLADVAKAAGVSKGTASNVFNRPDIVREEVRERVLAAAKAIGYHGPDPKGRLLSAGKVNAIGVATTRPVSYFFDDPFARELMAGISDACDAAGAGVALVSAANDEKLVWNIQSALVDGFILFCLESGPRLIELTRERQLPFVALELGFNDETVSSVGIDNYAGARAAARHIADLGHRRIAIVTVLTQISPHKLGRISAKQATGSTYGVSPHRARGYLDALAEYGIEADDIPIYETRNDDASTHAALERMFSEAAPPTAILAMSDRIGLAVIAWLKRKGLRAPQDVSVIGFDGIPAGAHSDPPLTTIQQPIAEIGRRAVKIILEHGRELWSEKLDVELVVRGSTAPLTTCTA